MPPSVPVNSRASVAWRCSYGTASPIQAMASGITPAAAMPHTTRSATSASKLGASADTNAPIAQAAVAMLTMRALP